MADKYKRVPVPASFYRVTPEKVKTTRATRNSMTGFFTGRRVVAKPQSDKTRSIRMSKDFDVNKDHKIDDRDLRKGQIIGRASPGTAKPTKVVVLRHWRQGKNVRTHTRKM